MRIAGAAGVASLLVATLAPIRVIAADPITASNFAGAENPLNENGAWVPLFSMSPDRVQFQKNNGAYADRYIGTHNNHPTARTTAIVPADHYSEIVVGHIGSDRAYVGPMVRVQTSGPAVDSQYTWWASVAGGDNLALYRFECDGTSYTARWLMPHSPVVDGDRLRLIARGPVIYGIKNGVRDFIYNTGTDAVRYDGGTTGILGYSAGPTLTDATIASWSTGAAPVSSGTWASSTFDGTEVPLDEGDRWYPMPGSFSGFKKAGGLAMSNNPYGMGSYSGVWSIAPPPTQYSEVTLGPVDLSTGGGVLVRIDRTALGPTGWMLFMWADSTRNGSGIFKLNPVGDATLVRPFYPTIVTGDKWRLAAAGNTLEVFRNGVSQFTYTTDGSYPAGDVGIQAYSKAFTFDAWEGGATPPPPPTITDFAPTSGPVGTSVQITGTNFDETSDVTFNGVSASFTVTSPTTIQATVPPAATTGAISLTTPGGTATSANNFTVSSSDVAFIQANGSVPQSPQTVISVPYLGQQTAGNLNVVVVGASDATAQVQSVTDTKNNSYVRAAGPSVHPSGYSLSIYYAANIGTAAAGANSVRVAFTGPAQFPDIRIAEYAGIDRVNPLDAVSAKQGYSATSDSGALTTTHGNDLLIAANQVGTWTSSAGPGYTSRLVTSPNGDILEDRVVTASGSYNATAPLAAPGDWIMQMVAFRGASPSSGLVAAYAFGEGAGTTVADASGKGHTGTISGASWTSAGKYGKALSFNGSTSFVDLGNAPDLQITGSMTWSAWIFATADPADDGQIVSKSGGPGWQLKTSPDTGPQTFAVGVSPDGSSLTQRYSTTVRALNTWYHVAGVYDATAGTLNIYVNGVLDNGVLIGTVPASQWNAPQNVNIGRRTGGYYFQGTIDELRLHNRALSQAEIQADMNAAIGGP